MKCYSSLQTVRDPTDSVVRTNKQARANLSHAEKRKEILVALTTAHRRMALMDYKCMTAHTRVIGKL